MYQQTLDYLFSQLPIYQRVGKAAYKADLNNTIALCQLLGHPENGFRSIHVAGTNGKGSTSHILASILMEAEYKVGLYTSPHLADFRERIRINGQMIPESFVVDFVANHRKDFEPIQPSFFELTVGMAFQYFTAQKVDIAVIETGLGGRLDSTNVITPEVSVITNIGLDHTHLLGDTIEQIATEKAGIIKDGVPVVIGHANAIAHEVFVATAAQRSAPIHFAAKQPPFSYPTDLLGNYQLENLKTARTTIGLLQQLGWNIDEQHIQQGARHVVENTGLLGRWQVLQQHPLTIADIGHNEDGIKQVLQQIKATPHQHLHFVLGMVNDKACDQVLAMLPKTATYYFCEAKIPRALPLAELHSNARAHGLQGHPYASVQQALESAQNNANESDLVFVGGSTFVVAEVV